DELLAAARREEQRAFLVAELLEHPIDHASRFAEAPLVPGGLMEREGGRGEERVIVEKTGTHDLVALHEAQHVSAVDEPPGNVIVRALGRTEQRTLAEKHAGIGERGDDEAVPARQDLVVAKRLVPRAARFEQLLARALDRGPDLRGRTFERLRDRAD